MKKLCLLFLTTIAFTILSAQDLAIVFGDQSETKKWIDDPAFKIHYYADDFLVGSTTGGSIDNVDIIRENAWAGGGNLYYIIYLPATGKDEYKSLLEEYGSILFENSDILILEAPESNAPQIVPAVHGGVVRIPSRPVVAPSSTFIGDSYSRDTDPLVVEMINQVEADTLESHVQHLQDYGTRNAYEPESVEASNWIFNMFESYGLDVAFHDFSMPGGAASDNVIATLTGTKYPDEYVVLGAHYDSYSWSGNAPGADDNATGTAGILEAARIMSQYEFDRSIIFCTWSGEEYGLYGSAAWAEEAADNGMNILGYFNMDMAGYLYPGNQIQTDVIAPASAQELVSFYMDVCETYLPDFITNQGALSGGDSDHTSFNNNGFMGIFPFEDSQNYSPYIHTSDDIIGLSVNSFEMHTVFTKAIIANVATMANQLSAPANLTAIAGDAEVELKWLSLDSVDHYNIYRDSDTIPIAQVSDTNYIDSDVENGQVYIYYVTAVFMGSGLESPPSNEVQVVPMPPILLPFVDDFETGAYYWTFDGSWGLKEGIFYSPNNSITESPDGSYANNLDITATLRAVDFSNYTDVELSFWTKYQIELDYDYMYLEVSTDGNNWDQLDIFTGNQNIWTSYTYSLNDYLGEQNVIIRFRFYSDSYVTENGMFIDDLMLEVTTGFDEITEDTGSVKIFPNPAHGAFFIDGDLIRTDAAIITILDASGRIMNMESKSMSNEENMIRVDTENLRRGLYLVRINNGKTITSKKIVIY